ncbi:MAG: AAA family ATPase, partial [Methylococcaceae bacterium]
MYKKFYGFQEMPFSLVDNSNENSIFLSQNYTKVLPPLVSSLNQKVSLKLVLGEDGIGKSTFINYLFNFFPKVLTAKLITVHLKSTQDFFKQVLISFGLKDSNDTSYDMLLQLSFFLSTKFKEQDGQSTLLIIDNADKISLDVLQGIELLLGLNVEDNQILQIILVGQPNIEYLQLVPGLYELLQNTSSHYILEPLTAEETQDYINYKINLAGGTQNNKIFDEQACSIIYEYSEGIPSIINWICDKSLMQSSLLNKRKISSELVFEVVNNQIDISEKKNTISLAPSVFVSGFVFTGIALTFFLSNHLSSFPKEIPNKQGIIVSNNLKSTPVKEKQKEISKKQEIALSSNLNGTSVKGKQKFAQTGYRIQNPEKIAKKEVFTKKVLTKEIKNSTSTIEVQLVLAERQIADLKLSYPKNDNAYETYTTILKDSPNEKRATKGLQFIANFYLKRAKKQLSKGMLAQSQRTVSIGLKTSPKHKELTKLEANISAAQTQTKKLTRISTLFIQAEQQIERLQLINPTNDNAYK